MSDQERMLWCLVHGQTCLTCGIAASLESDLLLKQRDKWRKLAMEYREAVERSRFYVEKVWNQTKGTEREGTAMGAASVLNEIIDALALPLPDSEEK